MEVAVERLAGIALIIVAISHISQPRAWGAFFVKLRALGPPGALINGMMSLSLGAIIVGFHGTQWTGWPAVVTFIGWAQVLKGAVNLCVPGVGLRSMGMVSEETPMKFVVGGLVMLPLAAAILLASTQPR